MERFLEFLLDHYLLSGTFVALFIAFVLNEMARGGKTVSPQGLSTLVNQQNARVIDVRDAAEFRAGHIAGSENFPYSRLADFMADLKSDLARPIVIVCNMGQVAGTVGQQLRAAGLTQVYRLDGGISNWKAQSLPVVRKK
ncbi:MAG: rhodanese [Moraxellaceae bacterium]|jgi:rhodanese-related sulfurtransferase|nr:rhodanese [Moraxellaceae bacterium]